MCRKTMTWLSNAVLPFALCTILQINPNCKSSSIHIYWHLFCTRCSVSSCKVENRIHRIDTIFVPKTKLYCPGSGVYSSIFSISICLRLGFCPISSNPFFLSRIPTIAFIVFKRKGNRQSTFATLEKHFRSKGLRKEFSARNYLGASITNTFQFKFKSKVRGEFKVSTGLE